MSSNKQHDEREWRRAIAILEARIEDLKKHYDAEFYRLHHRLDANIADLQDRLRSLAALVEGDIGDVQAQRIAAKLDELRAKSDAAYDLLQVTLNPVGYSEQPSKE